MAKRQPTPETPPSPTPEPASSVGQYTVVARRYRPQQFTDLVGQSPVALALMNAIKSDRVAHAYLFTGARGVGKTSTARILAKALNCVKGPTPTPCDQCEICQSITSGEDIDVLEIDGASNRGIDEVRAIRQNVSTRPSRSRYKIYIIDEVHMLTPQAFNALLKTLEEPPPHVKFIFATTEVQKIPITILSRCQRFDFSGIGSSKIVERLKQVVLAEGMKADDEALMLVARRAGGSMRDAQSLLDQLLAFGGGHLTIEQVHSLLGTAADDRILELAAAILKHDPKQALEIVQTGADEGLQLGEVLDQLIDYWRGLMLIHCAGPEIRDLNVGESHRKTVLEQAQSLTLDTILAGLDILTTTKGRLRTTSQALILLEMAVIRLARLDELIPLVQLTQWLSQPQAQLPKVTPLASAVLSSGNPAKKNLMVNPIAPKNGISTNGNGNGSHSGSENLLTLEQIWPKTVQEIGGILASHLEKTNLPAISGPKSLVIRFPSRYTAAYDYCVAPPSLGRIEAALKLVSGQPWSVRVEKDRSEESKSDALVSPPSRKDRERDLLQLPFFKKIVEGLGGRLLTLDDGFGDTIVTPVIAEPDAEVPEPAEN